MTRLTPEQQRWVDAYYAAMTDSDKELEMGRYTSDKGSGTKEFSLAPAGTHLARCYRIIDIGTRHSEYLGEPQTKNEIVLGWELPLETVETDEGEKPMVVSKFYTNSLNERANLRHDLESWRGQPFTVEELDKFDLENILGKPCMLTIVHAETKTKQKKAKVISVTGVPKGTNPPPQVNPSLAFWIEDWSEDLFQKLPEGFQRLITASDEFKALHKTTPDEEFETETADENEADDIPFN